MDSCFGVEREIEKVSKKYNGIREHLHSSLDELIDNISGVQQELVQGMMKFSGRKMSIEFILWLTAKAIKS